MYSVLYVDDEQDLLELTKLYLEASHEFTINTSTSAQDVLNAKNLQSYDAIISDYQMPGIDGIAFLKQVRTNFGDVPFILFTGRGREDVVIDAINSGADFYLQKGGDPKTQFTELVHKIKIAVDQQRTKLALKGSEKRLSEIIDFLPDATFAIDINGTVIAWNRAMEEMTGVRASDMVGKGNYEYAHAFYKNRRPDLIDYALNFNDTVKKNFTSVQLQGETVTAETSIPGLHGEDVMLWLHASPLYDKDGNRTGAIESIRDITGRKQMELDLRRSAEALANANKKLSLLSSITRHDIINKVTIILGYLKIAEKRSTDPEMEEYFSILESATMAIQSQIEFTRNYQNLGTQEPQLQEVNNVLSRLQVPSTITLTADVTGVELYADPMLEKVFSNLLDNSVRHGEHVTAITVTSRQSKEGLTIVWEDNGIGIPPDEKEQIFERGFGKNTGLGLFLVREILSITGITISETGEPGKGARFEMTVSKDASRSGDTRFV